MRREKRVGVTVDRFIRIMAASRNVLLNRLQEGTTFRTFNCDGSWNEYFFYLSPKIYVLCYNVSKKVLQNSATDCKICPFSLILLIRIHARLLPDLLKDCEVRSGFKTDTWIKALRSGTVKEQQVLQSYQSHRHVDLRLFVGGYSLFNSTLSWSKEFRYVGFGHRNTRCMGRRFADDHLGNLGNTLSKNYGYVRMKGQSWLT